MAAAAGERRPYPPPNLPFSLAANWRSLRDAAAWEKQGFEPFEVCVGHARRLATRDRALWLDTELHPYDYGMPCMGCGNTVHVYSLLRSIRPEVVACSICVCSEEGRARAFDKCEQLEVEERRACMSQTTGAMHFTDGNVVDDEHALRATLSVRHNLSTCTFAAELPTDAGAGAEAEPNVPLKTNVQRALRAALAERCACFHDTPEESVERSERDERDDWLTCTRCYLRITQERMAAVRAVYTPSPSLVVPVE